MDYNNNQQQYQQPQQQYQPYQQQPYQPPYQPPYHQPQAGVNGMAIAALVCGVLSLIIVWFLGWLGIILAICSIVFAGLGMKKAKMTGTGNGLAVGGLVCGIISLVVCIIAVIIVACAVSAANEVLGYYSF